MKKWFVTSIDEVVDYYLGWAGPCEAMVEFYKTLYDIIENAELKIEILQVEAGKFKFPEGNEIKGSSLLIRTYIETKVLYLCRWKTQRND